MSSACPITEHPYNAQRKPAEWDDLVTIGEERFYPLSSHDQQFNAARYVMNEVAKLDIETFEENRYFGLGLVTEKFVGTLAEPAARQTFVSDVAGKMARLHGDYTELNMLDRSRGLYLNEISNGLFGLTRSNKTRTDAYRKICAPERIVINALQVSSPNYYVSKRGMMDDSRVRNVLLDTVALDRVVDNSLAAATAISRKALRTMHENNIGRLLTDEETFTVLISDIADEGAIASLGLTHAGAVLASLRLDEFRKGVEGLKVAPDGTVAVNRSKIPKHPGPITDPNVPHQKRLRCPALYIAGAIPFVTQAMPQIINTAQRQLLPK